jgi:hypothetical protein
VLDNVDWDLISARMGDRNYAQCMEQWCARRARRARHARRRPSPRLPLPLQRRPQPPLLSSLDRHPSPPAPPPSSPSPTPTHPPPPTPRYSHGPSMVARGEWDPKEDKALVRALLEGGAAAEHEVDWGALVPGRGEAQVRGPGGGGALGARGPRGGARRARRAPQARHSRRGPLTGLPPSRKTTARRRLSAGG